MSFYALIKTCYHRIIPQAARHRVYLAMPRPIKNMRIRLLHVIESTAQHDEIYDAEYYNQVVEPTMRSSADAIADSICRDFAPKAVADVGCGTGGILCALKERGVQVYGFENSAAGIEICAQKGLEVTKLDIESDPVPQIKVDLVISTEVAEHLPASCADKFVDLLISLSKTVVLTAATPGQIGTDHVNCQPNSYWISKFSTRGFTFDSAMSHQWRSEWVTRGVSPCYSNSVMVFRCLS